MFVVRCFSAAGGKTKVEEQKEGCLLQTEIGPIEIYFFAHMMGPIHLSLALSPPTMKMVQQIYPYVNGSGRWPAGRTGEWQR